MIDNQLRRWVRERAQNRCEYCRLHQDHLPFARFHIDHIIARKHGGKSNGDNLALAPDTHGTPETRISAQTDQESASRTVSRPAERTRLCKKQ